MSTVRRVKSSTASIEASGPCRALWFVSATNRKQKTIPRDVPFQTHLFNDVFHTIKHVMNFEGAEVWEEDSMRDPPLVISVLSCEKPVAASVSKVV